MKNQPGQLNSLAKERKIFAVISCILLTAILLILFLKEQNMASSSKVGYDARTTIKGTGITFAYPKNGFNGIGSDLTKSDRPVLDVYEDIANYYLTSKPYGTPQVYLNVYKLGNETTIEQTLPTLANQIPEVTSGTYEIINDVRYLIVDADSAFKTAYTIYNGQLLAVTFGGFQDVSKESRNFLERLYFGCTDDCSHNSLPIIEITSPRSN